MASAVEASSAGRASTPNAAGVLKRGGVLVIAAQGLKLALQLSATAVLARLLAPAEFGLMSLVIPIVAFFSVFRDVGLSSATIYSDDITASEVSSLFWINVAAGVALAVAMLCLAPLASYFYGDARLTGILSVMALVFVINGVGAQYQALLQRVFRFKALTVIDLSAHVMGTVVGTTAAFLGYGYWSLVLIPIVTQATILASSAVISRWQPGRPRWEKRTAMMARFGSAISGFNILNYFARNVDNLLIGKFWGMEVLGYYGRAYSLMMAPLSQVIYPLNQVVVPVLTRINREPDAYVHTYVRLMRGIMLVCMPLVTVLIVGRVWVVDILLGPRWGNVIGIFLPLGFAALVQPMNNSAGWLMLSMGRSRDIFIWGVIGSGLTVLSIIAGLPWGPEWVAISYASGQILVVTPLLWWFACRSHFVKVGHLVSIAALLWVACAVAGFSFEAFHRSALFARVTVDSSILWLAIAFAWIFGATAGVLALHPSGRMLLDRVFRVLYRV